MVNQHAMLPLPEGRGTGAGSSRRNADAARAIKQFLRANQRVTARVEVHVIGPVRKAAAIARAAGFPVTAFDVVLENGTARHTLRRHGDPATEGRRGQLAVTEDDLARVAQLLCEFDSVEAADPTKQGTPRACFRKRIGAVDYEVFAEIRRAAEQVAFKTMLKRRVKKGASS